jgi:hypothetical protein
MSLWSTQVFPWKKLSQDNMEPWMTNLKMLITFCSIFGPCK